MVFMGLHMGGTHPITEDCGWAETWTSFLSFKMSVVLLGMLMIQKANYNTKTELEITKGEIKYMQINTSATWDDK